MLRYLIFLTFVEMISCDPKNEFIYQSLIQLILTLQIFLLHPILVSIKFKWWQNSVNDSYAFSVLCIENSIYWFAYIASKSILQFNNFSGPWRFSKNSTYNMLPHLTMDTINPDYQSISYYWHYLYIFGYEHVNVFIASLSPQIKIRRSRKST